MMPVSVAGPRPALSPAAGPLFTDVDPVHYRTH